MLRQSEAELVTQVRQALGAGRFDQEYTTGSQLTQRDAVAVIRDLCGTDARLPRPVSSQKVTTHRSGQIQ
ncbi:MAG TPA: hypothetical protein VGO16_11575 [Pseudonocardiaceae bacterium]|jgi:hypothetical protein|nr:hypothetical protein [Pseudonocardiaceae bacterium]